MAKTASQGHQLLLLGRRQRRVAPGDKPIRGAPGDVAVYGLSLGADPSAVHVAIVTDDPPDQRGPDLVNGDGDRTGFSVVETGTDQERADAGYGDSTLAGIARAGPAG